MSVSVTKSGPYFSSGSISFSQLRDTFTDDQPGFGRQISASQLRRNTDVRIENPIVPDSTENEQISTGSNLSLSQFRNSIKRYVATQTGTDDNQSYVNEPGFRMGRLDLNGRGIDWSGGGYNGRDGQGGGFTGNLTKNVQKGILITGTCGSLQAGQAAAQLSPAVTVHNVRIDVSGSILGYGGRGGGTAGAPDPDGESGATALNLGSVGFQNRVIVMVVVEEEQEGEGVIMDKMVCVYLQLGHKVAVLNQDVLLDMLKLVLGTVGVVKLIVIAAVYLIVDALLVHRHFKEEIVNWST
jgi:hypothetical protein